MPHESDTLSAELQALLDASPDAVLVVDRAGTVVALNRRTEALFGITADHLRGEPVETLLPERLRGAHRAARSGYTKAPTVRAMSTRRGLMGLRADGTEFPVEISLTPVVGSVSGLVMAVVHEVGARPTLEQALAPSDRTTAALDAIPDAIVMTDTGGRVDFLNQSAERLTGWNRDSARGRPVSEILPLTGDSGEVLPSPVTECLRSGAPRACEATLPAGPERESRVLDISTTPVHDPSGGISGTAVLARDVTQARTIARRLSHEATHDSLTDLVNRTEFERRLERALASSATDRAEHALGFIDLDGFKRVNDTCGHLAGDQLLRRLSDLMRERMRSRDTLARLGGDEFGMLLEHCPLPEAVRIAEEIRAAIHAYRFVFGGQTHTVGASIGIARIRTGEQPDDIMRAADSACYAAKRRGGNRIQVYDRRQTSARGSRNADRVQRIRSAIEEDRLLLYAQAVLPLNGAKAGMPLLEVLLRLDEGRQDPLLPGAFLPIASRQGLMPSIDRWVLRGALRRLSEWRRRYPGVAPPVVAINLGEETVSGGKAGELVRQALSGSGVLPASLCFEIPESVATTHGTATERLARELRAAGCRITLEHCGSGMGAFTLLRRLQVDFLKIAGSVVQNIARGPIDRVLAVALVEIGHALGLGTIGAEAENPETLACLRGLGVDCAQGYGVGRPEPLDTALGRLVAQ
jgi:diguanylate cyclase (GGDEF)-like protein/PAS domain S-box-containing protein